jgi:hypothetical protein
LRALWLNMDDGKCEMDDVDNTSCINYAPSSVPSGPSLCVLCG